MSLALSGIKSLLNPFPHTYDRLNGEVATAPAMTVGGQGSILFQVITRILEMAPPC